METVQEALIPRTLTTTEGMRAYYWRFCEVFCFLLGNTEIQLLKLAVNQYIAGA